MSKIKLEMRHRCPKCETIRSSITAYVEQNAASMDAWEREIDKIGSIDAHCPKCDTIEEVAFFANNKQTEQWMDAVKYERLNGQDAGPLPPKPWSQNE